MIHDNARINSIRSRAAAQLELITSLKASIVKGKLEELSIARSQTGDIETFFLRHLNEEDRTPADEAQWLNGAEFILNSWEPRLRALKEQFEKRGGAGIEIVGG
jgi:hypothetical protein